MKKLYDHREVSRLMGISEARVRHWERQGLVPHLEKARGRLLFDFQGLVAFRTVRDLRRQGVSLGRIRKCVAKLRRLLPGLRQPLAEVRISICRDQIILGKNRRRFTPEGQMLLDFSAAETSAVAIPAELYEELFCQALKDEEAGRLMEARQKYESILAALPQHVDAMVNLGNLLFMAGSQTAAGFHYLQALGIDPDHVEANYNLANLLESRGELRGAAIFYRKAIQEEPEFADAHFNLAMVLEAMGERAAAKRHWRRYLELAPDSQWTEYIKARLEES